MDSIKRALRSIFKRGKKKEQVQPASKAPATPSKAAPQQQQSSQQPPAPPAKDVPKKDTPAVGRGSAQQGTVKKDLPPTHPLATGQHQKPIEAVPQDHSAKPGPPALAPVVAGGPEGLAGRTRDESDPVSAISSMPPQAEEKSTSAAQDSAPAARSKEEGVAPAVKAAPAETAIAAPAVTESQPPHSQATREPAAETKPTVPAVDTAAAQATKENAAPQANGVDSVQSTQGALHGDEDKIPVDTEEPPEIKKVQVAPGMSATSGPLEDFPEGGDYRD